MELSVIVPTYRRPHSLLRVLESLQRQVIHDGEILVVDNEASPEIERLVLKNQSAFSVPLYYIAEPKLGLHHARHAGARAAKGQLLVFTDDDATFEANWLQVYVKAFTAHAHMVAAGGPVRPRWEAEPPKWLQQFLKGKTMFPILSINDSGSMFSLDPRGYFFGVNMAIRRSILFEVGGFNPDSFGKVWLGNGETGLNHKLWQREMLVGYVPDAIVYHHIPAERMTLEYFRGRMANEGACDMYTRFHKKMPGPLGLLLHASSIIFRNSLFWLIERLIAGQTNWICLRIQLQAARARSQLSYVRRLVKDQEFRKFVQKHDWLTPSCTSE